MVWTLSRLSEASTTCLMCSGWLFETALLAGVTIESELGGDDHFAAERSEGFADEFLVGERAIDFGGVEERDALFDGRADEGDHLLFIPGGAIAEAHAHAARGRGQRLPDYFFQVCGFAF